MRATGHEHTKKSTGTAKEQPGGRRSSHDEGDFIAELGPGKPLDPATRRRMEPVVGAKIDHVEVHDGREAASLARTHDAHALTIGRHIAFDAGQYRPGTLVGDALLAHELAHVAQQGNAALGPMRRGREGLTTGDEPALEHAADVSSMRAVLALHASAHSALAGTLPAVPGTRAGGLRLSRCRKKSEENKTDQSQQDAGTTPDAGPPQPAMPLLRTVSRGGQPDRLGKGESLRHVADRAYGHHEAEYIQILRDANNIPESQDRKLREGRAITVPAIQVPDPNTPPPAGTTATPLVVPFGPVAQMTFDSEGHDTPGRPGYSRAPSVPPQASGVTIGRGYDMGNRSAAEVEAELVAAGVPQETASAYAQGAGLRGGSATQFLRRHPELPELTREQQWSLFIQEYYRVSNKALEDLARFELTRPKAQRVDLNTIDPAITQMLVDLKYRGDLTAGKWGSLRGIVHDQVAFNAYMQAKANWPGVPYDRYRRRCEALGLTPEPRSE